MSDRPIAGAPPLAALAGRRLLVTGGTGFVGTHVVRMARAAGAEVHILARRAPAEHGAACHLADLGDAAAVAAVVRAVRPSGILHLAATGVAYGSSDAAEMRRINTMGLAGLFTAAGTLPALPSVVCAGSGFEYAPTNRPLREDDPLQPTSEYGLSKVAALAVATSFGTRLPITWVRLFSLYGPGEREPRLTPYVIGCARRGQMVELTAGEQVRDYTSVIDAAVALLHALLQPPTAEVRVVNFASQGEITLREYVELLATRLTARGLQPSLRFGAKPYRTNELMHYTADVTRWRNLFGWRPERSLAQGLEETLDSIL